LNFDFGGGETSTRVQQVVSEQGFRGRCATAVAGVLVATEIGAFLVHRVGRPWPRSRLSGEGRRGRRVLIFSTMDSLIRVTRPRIPFGLWCTVSIAISVP
jgi:hypothetical protein